MVIYAYYGGLRGKKFLACIQCAATPTQEFETGPSNRLTLPIPVRPSEKSGAVSYSARIYLARPNKTTAQHHLIEDLGQFKEQLEAAQKLEDVAKRKLDWALDPRDF